MKQLDIEKKAESQNREYINNVPAGSFNHLNKVKHESIYKYDYLVGGIAPISPSAERKGVGHCLGKAPPGRSRSPGAARGHPPAWLAEPPDQTTLQFKIQLFNKNQNSNYYKHLIFTIMKKQILFLVVFLLAAFASVNKSYGQCIEGPLTPIAGKEYTYSIAISGTTFTGTGGSYLWYVTSNPSLITNGTLNTAAAIAASNTTVIVGTGYTYGSSVAGQMDLKLTWSAEAIAAALHPTTPVKYYLVVQSIEANTAGAADCDVQNLKAWEIIPINLFNITIQNTIADGTVTPLIEICPANIYTATITPNTAPTLSTIAYDYGENALYFRMTAFNFTTSWTPTITFAGLQTGQTITSAVWSRTAGDFSSATAFTVTGTTATGTIPAQDTKTDDGEIIYVRYVVDHSTFEGTTAQNITITANGEDAASNDDVDPSDCSVSATDDTVSQTILARQTVTSTTDTPAKPFLLP